jgi:hypothetical protein
MTVYRRSEHRYLYVDKVSVDGRCDECGGDDLRRYAVIGEAGWEIVTKCQRCLASVRRDPWRRLGPIELLIDDLEDDGV